MAWSMLWIAFSLCGSLTQSARIAVHDTEEEASSATWGRSCESLQNRFAQQSANLAEREGARAFVASVSVLRTLRRANARNCDWAVSGDVDVSAIAGLARNYLQEAPCYDQARTAMDEAQNLPEEERDEAMQNALVLLLSPDCSAEEASGEASEEDASEEALEEEIDDATDEIMDAMASSDPPSLLQQEQNPLQTAEFGWWIIRLSSSGWGLIIGALLAGVVMALLCGALIHGLVRIFRWIRCSLFNSAASCAEYSPATWVRVLVANGCGILGLLYGPWGIIYADAYIPGVIGALSR